MCTPRPCISFIGLRRKPKSSKLATAKQQGKEMFYLIPKAQKKYKFITSMVTFL